MNWEIFGRAAYWSTMKIIKFLSLWKFLSLNWLIWESNLEQHSDVLISNRFVNCQKKLTISDDQYSKTPILNLWTNWGKWGNLHKIRQVTLGEICIPLRKTKF